jgi:hypothetical protein
MKGENNGMRIEKILKLITVSSLVLVCLLSHSQSLAREKGDVTKDKETVKIDIDLRFNQRATTKTAEVTKTKVTSVSPTLIEPVVQPQPVVVPPASSTSESEAVPAESVSVSEPAPVVVNALNILGNMIVFQNGGMANGQAVIDADPKGTASTWGGATPYSGTDGLNTHFIGHHWGAFDSVLTLNTGGIVTVYGADSQAYQYTIYKIAVVDSNGKDTTSGASLYGEITSLGGGERIVLQTCIDETTRRIVFAS